MDDLRAAVATVLALTPATRLVAIDAAELVDATGLAVYAAVGGGDGPRRVAADPLRLPFVAAIADCVVVRSDLTDRPHARLREIWRVLAPAGMLVLVVPLPTSYSLGSLIAGRIIRRRVAYALAAAMFDAASWQTAGGSLVVRAGKRDGLAPPRRAAAAVRVPATA